MKKLTCFILSLCIFICSTTYTSANEHTDLSIDSLATELLSKALLNDEYFNIPDIQKNIYICNPMNPCYVKDNTLVKNEDIEYYLIKTEDKYIADITVCYKNGQPLSACLSTTISSAIEECNIHEDLLLVVNDCTLYVKTKGRSINILDASTKNANVKNITDLEKTCERINSIHAELEQISVMQELEFPLTYVTPRSNKILDVPYVSQEGKNLCWAAAAIAFGRFYKKDASHNYKASELAHELGIDDKGGSMSDAQNLLSTFFDIKITIVGTMTKTQIVNKINNQQPILVGFWNPGSSHMVVLCGFDDGGTGENMIYYVRDSNFESYKIVKTLSNGLIAMDYLSDYGIMVWEKAAYKIN